MVLSLALGAFLALALGSVALATHPRPGGGTPFRVPLVPAFNKCGGATTADDPAPATPNATHITPLTAGSCTPPTMKSTTLTLGTTGAGNGSARLDVFCNPAAGANPGEVPPCGTTAGDSEDILVQASMTDVRCAVAFGTVCPAAGGDYTGKLLAQSVIRITDHSNGTPPTICANGTGSGCGVATVVDITFSVPIGPCVATGGANGSNCTVSTTIDSLLAGTVKELQRGVVAIHNIRVKDSGPDGTIDVTGNPCPLVCGTGDETKYQEQGIFIP
jgi:hypothetical protein